ncbi:MAG: transglutaminase domain-containing protein [Candidatus Omnitrophica bacterium]|nr:transglutaminase domain-containing protein [Candidatus Omnitrophota bacterium]
MRTVKWGGSLVIVTVVAIGVVSRATGSASVAAPHPREVLFTYQTRISQLPQQAGQVDVWVPLAKTTVEQEVLHREVRASVPYTIGQDPEYDNDILHLALTPPLPPTVEVSIDYRARLLSDTVTADSAPTADELPLHLEPRGLVIIDDEVRARAQQATHGRTTVRERARGIYDTVIQQVKYDKHVPGWGRGDTRRVCLLGAGNCTDFHSLFISMARASHIPARFKIGVVVPQEASGTIPGYHCWAEFYAQGQGWVPVDASEAWKHPELADYYFGAHEAGRLLLSVGRDLQLIPRQRNGPINIFFYPYVEIDGVVFDQVETQLLFQELKHKEAA